MDIVINFLLVVHVLVSLLIILLVLMQRPKNEGLGAAFGGGMTENLFGAQTTNVLQTITRWLGTIFFALTLLLSVLYVRRSNHKSSVQQALTAPTVIPAATPAPVSATPAPMAATPAPAAATPAPVTPAAPPAAAELPLIPPVPVVPVPGSPAPAK